MPREGERCILLLTFMLHALTQASAQVIYIYIYWCTGDNLIAVQEQEDTALLLPLQSSPTRSVARK